MLVPIIVATSKSLTIVLYTAVALVAVLFQRGWGMLVAAIIAAVLFVVLSAAAWAELPPAATAQPYYLGYIACTEDQCDTRYRPVYVESATACTTTAIMLLPQVLLPGETVEEWWCE